MNNKIILKTSAILAILFLINTSIVLALEYNLEYDANGNLIQGKDKYFEYNTLNQLFRVRENNQNGNILEEYFYDHEGNRVLKKIYESGQVTQEIYYIDKNFIQIVNSTGTFNEVYYYDDSGLIAERDTNGKLKAYHSDHLGSTNLVTNESGSVIEEIYYEPYGNELQDSNSRYTYTGKEKDTTGLMYYGARNYNPEQGQFIEPDKILPNVYDPQQLNRYAYARNNPYIYVDPTGLWATLISVGTGYSIMGIGVSVSGGIALSYSKQHGLQITLGGTGGKGLALGAIGRLSLGLDVSPSAKQVKDISGTSYLSGGAVAYGPYAGAYSRSEGSGGVTHGFHWTPGLGAEYREFETETRVLPWNIQIGGNNYKSVSDNQLNSLIYGNKQSTNYYVSSPTNNYKTNNQFNYYGDSHAGESSSSSTGPSNTASSNLMSRIINRISSIFGGED